MILVEPGQTAAYLTGHDRLGFASFAIRERLAHPQLVSTSRHLSQGGVDLVSVEWKDNALYGRSRVIKQDPYQLAIHVPAGFKLKSAQVEGQPVKPVSEAEFIRLAWTPDASREMEWRFVFDQAMGRD